jgi:2,4-diketo-3-deoxy-L-fuconate hydrolase
MQLIRFGDPGREKPGLQGGDGTRFDASSFGSDYDETFFGGDGVQKLGQWFKEQGSRAPKVDSTVRLGPPICRPSKMICVGLNYLKHAVEAKLPVPPEPIIFLKATSSLCGPNDDLIIPRGSTKMDYEVELAVIIGKKALYVSKEQAMDHVAGYALMNDYSERHFQMERSGQWVKGKSADTFAPLGPWVATREEIANPGNLVLWLSVNGERRQESNTSDLVFNVPTLVSYLSQFMTLLPGDVISTGTPEGVGMGMNPPGYLKPGDVVEQGADGLGTSRQRVIASTL